MMNWMMVEYQSDFSSVRDPGEDVFRPRCLTTPAQRVDMIAQHVVADPAIVSDLLHLDAPQIRVVNPDKRRRWREGKARDLGDALRGRRRHSPQVPGQTCYEDGCDSGGWGVHIDSIRELDGAHALLISTQHPRHLAAYQGDMPTI